VLDDIRQAFEPTAGLKRLRERAEVQIFTKPFGDPSALAGFDTLIANRERTRFTSELLAQLHDVRLVAQTGNHAYHVDCIGMDPARRDVRLSTVVTDAASY